MIPKKFRAYDTELGKYRTFYLSELLLDAPNFEFVDQYEVVQLVGHDKKVKKFTKVTLSALLKIVNPSPLS